MASPDPSRVLTHRGFVDNPPHGIAAVGPIVAVTLGLHPEQKRFVPASFATPTAVARMLVDTGAQRTLVLEELAQQIGLQPIRFENMIGVSHKAELHPVYRMGVALQLATPDQRVVTITFGTDVVGLPPSPFPMEHQGLIGRDFLRIFQFVYDGPTGRFVLQTVSPTKIPPLPAR